MQTSSSSRVLPALLLIPFAYFFATRVKTARNLAYHAASSFIPAWWLLFRLSGSTLLGAALHFLVGYLCFISLYEIGYLVNDTWDARRDETSRRRLWFEPSWLFCFVFVLLRVAVWVVLGAAMGWLWNPVWLACYAALVVVFAEHNLVRSGAVRAASFFQLTVLRFSAPIVGLLDARSLAITFAAALLFYTYFRLFSYLDSKELLNMPERQEPTFARTQTLMMLPLLLLIAYACRAPVIAELTVYFVLLYCLWALASRPRNEPGTIA